MPLTPPAYKLSSSTFTSKFVINAPSSALICSYGFSLISSGSFSCLDANLFFVLSLVTCSCPVALQTTFITLLPRGELTLLEYQALRKVKLVEVEKRVCWQRNTHNLNTCNCPTIFNHIYLVCFTLQQCSGQQGIDLQSAHLSLISMSSLDSILKLNLL
jgi:hypothetical protein